MRYPAAHKAGTRRRIVDGAAAALRARGVSRRRQAMAILSCLVGVLMLSRAVDDPETSGEILAAARRHLTEPAG